MNHDVLWTDESKLEMFDHRVQGCVEKTKTKKNT